MLSEYGLHSGASKPNSAGTRPEDYATLSKLRPKSKATGSGRDVSFHSFSETTCAASNGLSTDYKCSDPTDTDASTAVVALCCDHLLQLRSYRILQCACSRTRANSGRTAAGTANLLIWPRRYSQRATRRKGNFLIAVEQFIRSTATAGR